VNNLISKKFNFLKIEVPKSILLLMIVAVVFNLLRIILWGKMSFVYILWNLFLALIPFVISLILLYLHKEGKLNKLIFIIGIIFWIIFLPNAPYLVTDLIHLGETKIVPIIYDTLLLFSSALLGVVLAFYSLSHIEEIVRKSLSKKKTILIMILIILLVSFGIYLGRFLRFNSWDIFVNHYALLKNIWEILSQMAGHAEVYLFTIMYSFFLFFSYQAWKEIGKNDSF